MGDTFKIGDLVWARMKGFPPWPGKVSNPPNHLKKPKGAKPVQCIFFFGSNNFAWIEDANVKTYEENKSVCIKAAKSIAFKEACAAIEDYKAKLLAGEVIDDLALVPPEMDNDTEMEISPDSNKDSESPEKEVVEKKRRGRKPGKKSSVEENGEGGKEIKKDDAAAPIRKRKHNGTKVSADVKPPAASPSAATSASTSNHVQRKSAVANFLDRPITINKTTDAPLNISHVSQTLKDKKITPSPLRFGFLGLGTMGSGIVKNLLNSGHKVTVWNRTTDKCKNFISAGAEHGITPGDVIQTSDITFSCVSDPVAAKEMVFGNCGVLQEITAAKGYVEMTGTDAETSMDVAEAIGTKGGRYLEAQIQGSKLEAENGTLVILAAGDRDLYEDCQSAFQAMGKHSFYLGDVGNASKMNMVMQLLQGVGMATLAEGMALADRAGLQQRDVMEILALTSMACPLFLEKGNGIIEGTFPTHQPLQHMQKDLNLALGMGHLLEQPLPLAASANEIFKHAKRLGYGEHDMAAVYIRARF